MTADTERGDGGPNHRFPVVMFVARRVTAPSVLLSVTALALAVLTFMLATESLARNARYFPLLDEAGRLEGTGLASRNVVLSRRAELAAEASRNACGDGMAGAASRVALANFLSKNAAHDYKVWTDAASVADESLRHALSCAPGDGVIVAHLALVERLSSLSVPLLQELLVRSQRLAPSEPAALVARIQLWKSVPLAEDAGAAAFAARRADLRAVLERAWPPEVVYLLEPVPQHLRAVVARILSDLSADRIRFLEAAGFSGGQTEVDGAEPARLPPSDRPERSLTAPAHVQKS